MAKGAPRGELQIGIGVLQRLQEFTGAFAFDEVILGECDIKVCQLWACPVAIQNYPIIQVGNDVLFGPLDEKVPHRKRVRLGKVYLW